MYAKGPRSKTDLFKVLMADTEIGRSGLRRVLWWRLLDDAMRDGAQEEWWDSVHVAAWADS